MHNTSHEFGFVDITNRRSLKVISEISPLRHQPAGGNRCRIVRWLANSVVLCQNDVICEFHSPKTMELILVVVISAGMAENSQNGVSRSLMSYSWCPQQGTFQYYFDYTYQRHTRAALCSVRGETSRVHDYYHCTA